MKTKTMKKVGAVMLVAAVTTANLNVSTITASAATVKAKSMTLNVKNKMTMYVGASDTIKVKAVSPKKANKAASFKSSNAKVVKITAKGKITALKAGKATITVTSKSNKKLTKKVTVTVKELVKNAENNSVYVNLTEKKYKLNAAVKASNLSFKSSNNKVATVDGKGVIAPKKAGTAKITVTGKKGNVKGAKQVITVYVSKKAVKSVKLNTTKKTIKVGGKFTLKATVSPKDACKKVSF